MFGAMPTKMDFHIMSCMIMDIRALDVKRVLHLPSMQMIYAQAVGKELKKRNADCIYLKYIEIIGLNK
jgi:hypothetical protein